MSQSGEACSLIINLYFRLIEQLEGEGSKLTMRKYPLSLIYLALTALSLTWIGESTAAKPIQATTPKCPNNGATAPSTPTRVSTQTSKNPRQAQLLHKFQNPSIPPLNATSV